MENLLIAYVLKDSGFLGYIPECVAIYTDEGGHLSTRFVKVTGKNRCNYLTKIDSIDEELIKCCLQLDSEVLLKQVNDKEVKTIDQLTQKYFGKSKSDPAIQLVRKTISSYINKMQNLFFDKIGDKTLFLPTGKLPFMWKRLFIEEELADLKYKFIYNAEGLRYSLGVWVDDRLLDIKGAALISQKRARILIDHIIYEFEAQFEGAKLVPFFTKDTIQIPLANTEEYLQKFVIPIVAKHQIESEGITIRSIKQQPHTILKISELKIPVQTDIFGSSTESAITNSMQLDLLFEYEDFVFKAGRTASLVRLQTSESHLSFVKVERDNAFELQQITSIGELGQNLSTETEKIPSREAIDWINKNYEQLELLGVDIVFENQDKLQRKYFLGKCTISLQIEELNDWFDVKGSALFGEFEIPILIILSHIRNHKTEIRLPNGEYAQIPQEWFDEYQTFTDCCSIEGKKVTIAKHFVALADQMKKNKQASLSLKGKLRKFIEVDRIANYDLPNDFSGELRNYQLAGYHWLRLLDELNFGGCLADDMGLGKTIQTLCLLQWMKEQKRGVSLLVVPTSLVFNWQMEVEKFCPNIEYYIYAGKNRSVETIGFKNSDLIITTYAIVRRDIEFLKTIPFNYLILDEAQAIKNPYSTIAQACLGLKANRFLSLTGTPVENSLTDLWSQMNFLNRNMLGDVNRFIQQCKKPEKINYYRQTIRPFVMRRLKSAVLTDLPEKSIFVQYCDMSPAQSEFYLQRRNAYRDQFLYGSKEESTTFHLLEGLLRMRQSANHPVMVDETFSENSGKFEMVCHKLDEVVHEGNKVLVFSSFVEHLQLYKNYLDEKQISYCYLDGSIKDRQAQVQLFQETDDHQIFLLSLKAGGTGLNLTRAEYVFLLDPWWNPAAEAQAFDRAHRIGQKNRVFVYKFISRNTIEEKILKLQETKIDLFNLIVEAETDFQKQLNREELIELLG